MHKKRASVVFATGPDTEQGGPAKYVRELMPRFEAHGVTVKAVRYSLYKVRIPGLRQCLYFFRLLAPLRKADAILAFDTLSVGIPALLAAKLLRKRIVVRVGGDFLWERYVERTGNRVRLSNFYTAKDVRRSYGDQLIFSFTRALLLHADVIAFNTSWQLDLWRTAYSVPLLNAVVIENYFPPQTGAHNPSNHSFVSAGRTMKLRDISVISQVFEEVRNYHSEIHLDTRTLPPEVNHNRLMTCYAILQSTISDVAPNMLIEAASMGIPFIATDDTGIRDRLEGKGLFIDMKDPEALKHALETILDSHAYQRMKNHRMDFEHSWDAIAQEFGSALGVM